MARRRTWIEEVADALQVAALLATRLRKRLGGDAQDAVNLEAALDRAVRALRRRADRAQRATRRG